MFGDFGLDWAPTSFHGRGLQGGEGEGDSVVYVQAQEYYTVNLIYRQV